MKHFIATRFNLKVDSWTTAKDGSMVLTDDWLEERFELFQKYCLPSVMNQKNQNFYWVVFFDTETPTKFKLLIEQIANKYINFNPIFVEAHPALKGAFQKFILEKLEAKDEFIITTRLDNDDSIHENFTNTIQEIAQNMDQTVIDLRRGYQLDISNSIYKYRNHYNKFNPFLSFIESTKGFNTVFSKMHSDWKSSKSIIVYDSTPLWIEIVHKKNKLNEVKLNKFLIPTINFKEFGIIKDLKEFSYFNVIFNNILVVFKKIKKIFS